MFDSLFDKIANCFNRDELFLRMAAAAILVWAAITTVFAQLMIIDGSDLVAAVWMTLLSSTLWIGGAVLARSASFIERDLNSLRRD